MKILCASISSLLVGLAWTTPPVQGLKKGEPDCLKVGETVYIQSTDKDNRFLKKHHSDQVRIFNLEGEQRSSGQIKGFQLVIRMNDGNIPRRGKDDKQDVVYGKKYSFENAEAKRFLTGGSHGGHGSGFFPVEPNTPATTKKEARFDIRPYKDKSGGHSIPNDHIAKGKCVTNKSIVYLKLSDLANNRWLQAHDGNGGHVKAYDMLTTGHEEEFGWIIRRTYDKGLVQESKLLTCRAVAAEGNYAEVTTSNGHANMNFNEGVSSDTSTDYTNSAHWEASASVTVEADFKFGSVSTEASFSYGQEWSKTLSNTFSQNADKGFGVTFNQPGTIWQFVTTITDICQHETHLGAGNTAGSKGVFLTEDSHHPPCCPPKYFKDETKPEGRCRIDSYCLCSDERCAEIIAKDEAAERLRYAPIAGKVIHIKNKISGKAIAVKDGKCAKGQGLVMEDYEPGNPNQQWVFDSKTKQIKVNKCQNFAMDLDRGSCTNGNNVGIYTAHEGGHHAQMWEFEDELIKVGKQGCNKAIHVLGVDQTSGSSQLGLGGAFAALESQFQVVVPPKPASVSESASVSVSSVSESESASADERVPALTSTTSTSTTIGTTVTKPNPTTSISNKSPSSTASKKHTSTTATKFIPPVTKTTSSYTGSTFDASKYVSPVTKTAASNTGSTFDASKYISPVTKTYDISKYISPVTETTQDTDKYVSPVPNSVSNGIPNLGSGGNPNPGNGNYGGGPAGGGVPNPGNGNYGGGPASGVVVTNYIVTGSNNAGVGSPPPPNGGYMQPQQSGYGQPQQNAGNMQPQQNAGYMQPQQRGGSMQPQQAGGNSQPQTNGGDIAGDAEYELLTQEEQAMYKNILTDSIIQGLLGN